MIVIRNPASVIRILRPDIRSLIEQRFTEITGGHEGEAAEPYDADIHGYFIVAEPGDSVDMLEKEVGCPIMHNLFDDARFGDPEFTPCFEVLEEHAGCYEMVPAVVFGASCYWRRHPVFHPSQKEQFKCIFKTSKITYSTRLM